MSAAIAGTGRSVRTSGVGVIAMSSPRLEVGS